MASPGRRWEYLIRCLSGEKPDLWINANLDGASVWA